MKQTLGRALLTYFRFLAKLQLKKYAPDIYGITGSAGKTSTMHAVAAVLSSKYETKVGYKANSESGIPLNILGLQLKNFSVLDWLRVAVLAPWQLLTYWEPYEKYVVEMGIDSPEPPKNMEYLLSIVQPRVGIFLNALPVHSEPFDKLIKVEDASLRREKIREAIAREKGKLIASLPDNGLAVLNADDQYVLRFAEKTRATVMTFGKSEQNDVVIGAGKRDLAGTEFTFSWGEEKATMDLTDAVLPDHYAYSIAAALCIALDEGYSLQEGVKMLEKEWQLPKGRSSLIKGINDSLIIDSSYNSSLHPLLDLLDVLQELPSERKVALLGDMRELGEEGRSEHVRAAKRAAEVADVIYLVGPLMQEYALPVLMDEMEAGNVNTVRWFDNTKRATEELRKEIKLKDVLLIKASQNTLLFEIAVEELMAEPEKAGKLLCRRGEYWDSRRAEL